MKERNSTISSDNKREWILGGFGVVAILVAGVWTLFKHFDDKIKQIDIAQAKVCYKTEIRDWSSPYTKTQSVSVPQIDCGSKAVKDPSSCGIPSSITIPLNNGMPASTSPVIDQERFVKVVSGTCNNNECCRYSDSWRDEIHHDKYVHHWRHRACSTTVTKAIEVQRFISTNQYEEKCDTFDLKHGFFEFSYPKNGGSVRIFPLKPDVIEPAALEGVSGSVYNSYNFSCSEFEKIYECIFSKAR